MKKLLVVCVLVISVCSLTGRTSGQRTNRAEPVQKNTDTPFVTRITPSAAPSDAVIQLSIQSGLPEAKYLDRFRLTIGGTTAQFYLIDQNDKNTVAAVVPKSYTPSNQPQKNLIPVEVVFYDSSGEKGLPYTDFSVLVPTEEIKGKEVQIVGVRRTKTDHFNVTFNDYIPVELWPKTTIYVDGNVVRKVLKMEERSFTIELPAGVDSERFRVFANVGGIEGPSFRYDYFGQLSTPSPSPSSTLSSVAPTTSTPAASNWTPFVLVPFILALALVGLFYLVYKRLRPKPLISETTSEAVEEVYVLDDPPSSLVDACVAGDCVLYAGAGLGAQAGLPTWNGLVRGLLDWAEQNKFIDKVEADAYRADVDRGQADAVADSVVSRLTTEQQLDALNSYLQGVFLKRVSPSALHGQVKDIDFSAVLTTNFDTLLDSVYGVNTDQIFTPKDMEQLLAALTRRAFFILKLYGTLDRKDTVIVAPAQYADAITGNGLFSQFMQTLFFSRTLFFIGASLEGIKSYLEGISLPRKIVRNHYAVVAVTGPWRAQAELLERRYGIKVLPYTPSRDHAELRQFLTKLSEAVAARQGEVSRSTQKVSKLKRITLQNIGPFENLNLDLGDDSKWHIFLGDNGVGKSTVLKATALALCGTEAQRYAGRLLRDTRTDKDGPTQETVGTITLETTNGTSYVTTLKRHRDGEVELTSTTARPLEAEGWLAMGFPPLRTTSWEPPKGPEADITRKSRPVVSDLLPLVSGDVDPRLDKLKQWIVNLDYLDAKDKNSKGHYRSLIQKMFHILGEVAEGMKLTYKGVDKANRILLETEDGTLIPLEGLSQGTISLIGWIGILMQRLYEVFDEDEDPTQRYALILMDEIDAHMHPLWQRTLVTHLKELFPAAQFIATTHSPLVIAGMPGNEVVRFARENGVATVLPIVPDMTQGYTDQVLTSMLFGLSTTLGAPTEKKMDKFYELDQTKGADGKPGEYEQLRKEIIAEVPPWTASYEEKHAAMRERAEVLKQAGEKLRMLSPEEGDTMVARADHLFSTLGEKDK